MKEIKSKKKEKEMGIYKWTEKKNVKMKKKRKKTDEKTLQKEKEKETYEKYCQT